MFFNSSVFWISFGFLGWNVTWTYFCDLCEICQTKKKLQIFIALYYHNHVVCQNALLQLMTFVEMYKVTILSN